MLKKMAFLSSNFNFKFKALKNGNHQDIYYRIFYPKLIVFLL
jgi:hypothetical protein